MNREQIKKRLDLLEAITKLIQQWRYYDAVETESATLIDCSLATLKGLAEEIVIDDLED